MDSKKIENTYLKKIKLLTRFNKNYFDKAKLSSQILNMIN